MTNCMKHATLTAAQIRAARALLGWSRDVLAAKSGISLRTLASIELEQGNPEDATLDAIRNALVAAGVIFIEKNGGGPGVRLRKHG